MRIFLYPRFHSARRIVPALGALVTSVLATGLLFPQSFIEAAPETAEASPGGSLIGLRGSYFADLHDIGPHAPGAFAPRSAGIAPHDVFVARAETAGIDFEPTGTIAPLPPERPFGLQTARGALSEPVAQAPVFADVPTPPRRPVELTIALKPEPPRASPREAAAVPLPSEPIPSAAAPEPRRVVRTTVVPAATAENRGFFERIFGGAPQAAAPESAPRRQAMAYAATNDAGGLFGGLRSAVAPANPTARYDRYTAVYDISARTVYMPDGARLEAHSGLREHLDDPRYVHLRMRGPTPPHIYELTPREALFHGVEALRLNPVGGDGAIYHRAGLLAHTYMLGPNGDSNGCVSFRDYRAFLNAYKRGEIRRLAVVSHM